MSIAGLASYRTREGAGVGITWRASGCQRLWHGTGAQAVEIAEDAVNQRIECERFEDGVGHRDGEVHTVAGFPDRSRAGFLDYRDQRQHIGEGHSSIIRHRTERIRVGIRSGGGHGVRMACTGLLGKPLGDGAGVIGQRIDGLWQDTCTLTVEIAKGIVDQRVERQRDRLMRVGHGELEIHIAAALGE